VVTGQDSTESLIFSAVYGGDGADRRRQELISAINNSDLFKGEYHVLYTLAKEFPRIELNRDFIMLYLQTNKAQLSKNVNIDLNKYAVGDNEPYVEFVNSCIGVFDECNKRVVDDATFYRSLEMHKMSYISMQSVTILEESAIILSEGAKVGGKTLSGYSDMRSNLRVKFQKVDNLLERKDRKGIIVYGNNDNEESEEDGLKLITSYGLSKLDSATGGIYEGDMVSLLAPSNGGKSRFATFVLHNAIVNHGAGVVMWPIENSTRLPSPTLLTTLLYDTEATEMTGHHRSWSTLEPSP